MIQVSGYAAQQAKAPLAPYSFARREPRDYDIVIDVYIKCEMSGGHQHSQWFQDTRSPVSSQELVLKQLAIRWATGWQQDALLTPVVNVVHAAKELSNIVWRDRP